MHRALFAFLGCLLLAPPAMASPVIVWLQPQPATDKEIRKAESVIDSETFTHLSGADLAYPPEPWGDEDERDYEALRAAVIDGRARWDQFDVELDIAQKIDAALKSIDVVRDSRDVEQIDNALLLEGAAVSRAFPPQGFQDSDEAAPFRASVPGAKVIRPWVWAMGLMPQRNFNRGDLADGSPWPGFQALQSKLNDLPPGYADLSALPPGLEVNIDGKDVDMGTKQVDLRPGTHFLHVERNGVPSGRQIIKVDAGLTTDVVAVVDAAEMGAAAKALLSGTQTGFPDDVDHALKALSAHYGGDLYVAADDGGRVVVQPYGGKAQKVKRRPVTVVVNGEIGAGVIVSSLFDGSNGSSETVPMANGGLGLEIGIYNGALIGGFDLALTPGKTVTHGNKDSTANVTTSVLEQAWGGVGGYILRPNEAHTTLLAALTYGWYGPAHLGFGGRVTLGVPIDQRGTWFRVTVGGVNSPKSMWDTGSNKTPFSMLFMRFGFGARF